MKDLKESLKELKTEDLKGLLKEIKEELERRESVNDKVLIILRDEFNAVAETEIDRYNGGWTKKIVGLDKTKTNGYSLVGNFVNKTTKKEYYSKGTLFLDCDIQGSRRHPERIYQLFYLNEDGKMEFLGQEKGADYAVNFWDRIEKKLDKKEV